MKEREGGKGERKRRKVKGERERRRREGGKIAIWYSPKSASFKSPTSLISKFCGFRSLQWF